MKTGVSGPPAAKWQSQNLSPGHSVPKSILVCVSVRVRVRVHPPLDVMGEKGSLDFQRLPVPVV